MIRASNQELGRRAGLVADLLSDLCEEDRYGVIGRAWENLKLTPGSSPGAVPGVAAGLHKDVPATPPHRGEAGEPTGERRGLCLPGGSALEGK